MSKSGFRAVLFCALIPSGAVHAGLAGGDAPFIRGDANADGLVVISDPVLILNWLFSDGPDPLCFDAFDTHDDGDITIIDPIALLNWLFSDGPLPSPPGPFECGLDPTDDLLSCESFPLCDDAPPPSQRITLNSDGSVNGIIETDPSGLFELEPGRAESAFKEWIVANASEFGLNGIESTRDLDHLQPSEGDLRVDQLAIFFYGQTYRGHEVVGPEHSIALTIAENLEDGRFRAMSFTGTVLDPAPDYSGLKEQIPLQSARRNIRLSWLKLFREARPRPSEEHTVGEVDLVAVPQRKAIAYRGEILDDGQVIALVFVSAADGEYLGYNSLVHFDAFDRRAISVHAYEVEDNPDTSETAAYPTLGSVVDGSCEALPPRGRGCLLRMGSDRVGIYDFRGDNDSPPIVRTATEYIPGSDPPLLWGVFNRQPNSVRAFTTQNIYQKATAATRRLDPLKESFPWDHHPDAPFGSGDPAPLSIWSNIDAAPQNDPCSDSPAAIHEYNFDGWDEIGHPYPTASFPQAAIAMCSRDEGHLFHEIGHYYDLYSRHGIFGSGLVSDTCVWDTTDEALPLRESIADLVRLALYRELYSSLPYDLSTTDNPCWFNALGLTFPVHGEGCSEGESDVGDFAFDRPSASVSHSCTVSTGYRMASLWQAQWKFMNYRTCAVEGDHDCSGFRAALGDPPASMIFLRALFYALSLSNLQSYEQFVENMAVYIGNQYGSNWRDRFRRNFADHGVIEY